MDKIEEILTRGVANIIPGKEELKKKLASGKKLNIYLGIDPTAPRIHLGHAVPLRKLQQFAELGHNVILLIGDFTALVGDTSDKESERPILTEAEIKQNFQTYKVQAEKIIDFSKVQIRHNREWLSNLTYKDVLRLKQQFSLNDFISRELIKKRLGEGKRIRLDETEYPIMQGYDSYFLDTDIQLGATDQTFNMQAGRTLQKALRNKDSFVLANGYLEGTDGRKMSKSWGNAIWLDDSAYDMYAKVMAIKDDLIIQYFTLATNVPLDEVNKIEGTLKNGEHPMKMKKQLAFQIVSELHDHHEAEKAAKAFENIVQKDELPTDIPVLTLPHAKIANVSLADALAITNLALSKSDAKRLIDQGGVRVGDTLAKDPQQSFESLLTGDETLIQVGKRRFVKVKIEK